MIHLSSKSYPGALELIIPWIKQFTCVCMKATSSGTLQQLSLGHVPLKPNVLLHTLQRMPAMTKLAQEEFGRARRNGGE